MECTITAFPWQLNQYEVFQQIDQYFSAVGCFHVQVEAICVYYLSRCEGPSMQQGQQTAESCSPDSRGSTASTPHQIGQQTVRQELL